MCSSQESQSVLTASLPTTCCTSVVNTVSEVNTGSRIRSGREKYFVLCFQKYLVCVIYIASPIYSFT